ncbi:MAG TPA: Fe-S oxidoreductase, partial [Saprospiraceae bacterium]|nr:Fe-S oxidoreductase [Saprospiraceae bacterium]
MIQQILFILVTIIAVWYAYKQYARIWKNIKLGKPVTLKGDKSQRWRNVFLVALGQKKMFKKWIPGLFHFFIYSAFLITQIELIEIFVDGIFGTHRPFASMLGG